MLKKRNETDSLFDVLNSYHPNTKITLTRKIKKFKIPNN